MTICAMGKKSVVLGLAMCLVLSSFNEVSCQVGGSTDFETLEGQAFESNVQTSEAKATSSVSQSVETEFEAAGSHEVGQSSSGSDDVRRLLQGYNKNAGSDGVNQDAELMDASEIRAKNQEQVEEFQRQMKATASSKTVVEEETTEETSKLETRESTSQGGERNIDQIYYGNNGEKESEEIPEFMINEPKKIENEAASKESSQQYESSKASMESRLEYESSKTSNSGSGIMGSIGQSGAWRCINQDKNGVKEEDSIVIPKYDLNDIIKEESIKGSSSKTSSLITSLSEIVENHKKGRWTDVKIGKVSTTETSEKVKNLKATLKKFVGIKVRELVARSDYEEILTMAARYEELTAASVTYISRLATYGTVIREGFKASQQIKTVHQRVILHENVAIEKQKRVDAEFESVKSLAQKGDNLAVQIFAMKKTVLKLEAEKKEVDIEFQKIVENLSRVLEESSQAYEKHRVVVREWKEVQASAEYSYETIEKADVVWVQFLNTLTQ